MFNGNLLFETEHETSSTSIIEHNYTVGAKTAGTKKSGAAYSE